MGTLLKICMQSGWAGH